MSIRMHNGVLWLELEEATDKDGVKYGQQAHGLGVQPTSEGVVFFPKAHSVDVQTPIVLGENEMLALTLRLMELCDIHKIGVGMVDSVDPSPHLAELDEIDDDLSDHR